MLFAKSTRAPECAEGVTRIYRANGLGNNPVEDQHGFNALQQCGIKQGVRRRNKAKIKHDLSIPVSMVDNISFQIDLHRPTGGELCLVPMEASEVGKATTTTVLRCMLRTKV